MESELGYHPQEEREPAPKATLEERYRAAQLSLVDLQLQYADVMWKKARENNSGSDDGNSFAEQFDSYSQF